MESGTAALYFCHNTLEGRREATVDKERAADAHLRPRRIPPVP